MKKPFEIPLTLDVPFGFSYDLKAGTISFQGVALVLGQDGAASGTPPPLSGQPPHEVAPSAPQVRLSLTPQATEALLKEIDRLVRHSRDILTAAGDGSPSDATH